MINDRVTSWLVVFDGSLGFVRLCESVCVCEYGLGGIYFILPSIQRALRMRAAQNKSMSRAILPYSGVNLASIKLARIATINHVQR